MKRYRYRRWSGVALTAWMQAHRFTVAALAERLHCHTARIYRYQNGTQRMRPLERSLLVSWGCPLDRLPDDDRDDRIPAQQGRRLVRAGLVDWEEQAPWLPPAK